MEEVLVSITSKSKLFAFRYLHFSPFIPETSTTQYEVHVLGRTNEFDLKSTKCQGRAPKILNSLQPTMFDTVCTYPLSSDLFAQAIHPTDPLLALGLASGHVQINRLPPSNPESPPQAGRSCVETAWRTRRHKGSCRSLCFSHDGKQLFSAGTDGLVKIAATETGQVQSKIAVPLSK